MVKKANKKAAPAKDAFDDMVDGGGPDGGKSNAESTGTALDVYSDTPLFDPDDILIPRLRLAQGLTTEVQEGTAKPGEWIIAGFESVEEVVMVPILFGRMRELRDEDTRELTCFSKGAEVGLGDPGGVCAECPLAKWAGDGKSRKPPTCSFMYAYIVFSDTHDVLASISFQRTQIPAGKMLNTIVQRTGLGKGLVRLGSNQRDGKRGKFFVPAVNPMELDEGILAAAVKMAKEGL